MYLESIDAYIADQEPWKQTVLWSVRSLIHEADTEVTEAFKWGAPTYEHDGPVVWMFCAKAWVHIAFPRGVLLQAPNGFWEEGADTVSKSKRTIKVREGQELPIATLKELVIQAVENNLAAKTGR